MELLLIDIFLFFALYFSPFRVGAKGKQKISLKINVLLPLGQGAIKY